MRRFSTLLIGCVLVFAASTAHAEEVVDPAPFSELLSKYVDGDGQVAYAEWKENNSDLEKLQSYLEKVAEADPSGHSKDARLAFYLNAYNAAVLASIIDHWPTDSPQSIKGFFKVEEHEIAGESMTLDQLEHGLIREKFDEPRIHFVLVCAAKSCPRLRQSALSASNLESSLESAAREFIPRVTERKDESTVVTSKLFEWFAEDFEGAAGSVREYLANYTDGKVEEALSGDDVEIEFHSYDWSVNKQ